MPLTASQTTFRRLQTDDPSKVEVFFSIDATDALGRIVAGPMESVVLDLNTDELGFAAEIVTRAREVYVARKNQPEESQA